MAPTRQLWQRQKLKAYGKLFLLKIHEPECLCRLDDKLSQTEHMEPIKADAKNTEVNHPQLKQNHRFAGLFDMSRRRGPVQSARETTPTPPPSHYFPQSLPSETHTSCWQAVPQSPAPHMHPKP